MQNLISRETRMRESYMILSDCGYRTIMQEVTNLRRMIYQIVFVVNV